jgi:hypothetical protein
MSSYIRLLILLFPALLFACKKESENITFGEQPLSVVKSYVSGRWKFIYAYGGFTGNYRYDYVNAYLEFYGDSIVQRSHDTIAIATKIEWKTITDIRGKQAYYMQFKGGGGYVVDEIKNGELILFDNAYDGMAHYLHRVR